MTRIKNRSGTLPAGRDFLRTDAKTDVVGDRNHLIQVGMAAVWFALLAFTVQRLVVALQTGLLTPWWGNAAGLVALTALWAWYRRGPQTRSSGAANGTALIATITLLIPVAYGQTSTIWWLSLVGYAAIQLGRRQEAIVWGVTIPLVIVASMIVEPYVQIQGAAGELPMERAIAKIVFVVILIGIAVGFRRVSEQRALALHDSEANSTEARQKSQDLLAQAEKLGKVGGWEFDIDNKQQTWTDQVYEIHELDATNRPTVDQGINFYTPASRPVIERAVQRAIEQGEPFDLELEIITAKGNLRSVHAIGKADSARRKISGFFQDITERKQAEEALLQSRRAALNMMTDAVEARDRSELMSKALRLKNLVFDASMSANSIADLNGVITEANEAFVRVWGFSSKDDVVGKPIPHFLNDQNEAVGIITALNNTGHWEGDYTGKKKDGSTFIVNGLATTIKDEKGTVIGYQSACMNATEQREAQKELKKHRDHLEQLVAERTTDLKKSEERFRTMADFTYDWEYWIGMDRRMQYISPSCERVTGFPPASFYQDPLFINTIIHPDDRQSFEKHIDKYHIGDKHKESCEMELRIVDKNGCVKWIAHLCTPVMGDDRAHLGRRVSNRDITERKRAEEELRRQSAVLEASNHELESFAYSVSHDLRAPLRTIDGFSQIIMDDYSAKVDEQGRDYLQRIKSATQKMGQLIDDMLKLSRITRQELKREEVDLSMMARKISAELSKNQPERQVEFVIKPGCTGACDRQLIGIALENLIGNSWKYSSRHPSAKIEFGATEKDGKTVYFVRDDGAGFDPVYADKLFAPFQRLHTASEFQGNGIGLATIQRIVRKHGGSVWAEGQVEKGATFYFTLE